MSLQFPALPSVRGAWLPIALAAVLTACGGGGSAVTDPEPEAPAIPYVNAQVGDVLQVRIEQLRPTQAVLGYDQIYYHLGRKQPDMGRYAPSAGGYLGDDNDDNYSRYLYRSERKRADDYCADTGRGGIDDSRYQPHTVRLIDPTTYACTLPAPTAGSAEAAALKTVVVGPGGALYLTDGHHTFTTLHELSDGGPSLPVWVRVAGNYSGEASMSAFWQRMADHSFVWLRDANDQTITPAALPTKIALSEFQDDAYRSLVYLTRDMGYSNANVSEFTEFFWGTGLRQLGMDLANYQTNDLTRARIEVVGGVAGPRAGDSTTSYPAAVRDAALLMVGLQDGDLVAQGRTAAELGKLPAPTSAGDWNTLLEDEVWRADTNSSGRYRTAGKAWFALKYRSCGGPAATQAACWLTP